MDWSKSAAEDKTARRTQYAAMVERIEAGEVSDVYAYALDRLNRSLIMSARFAKACEANNVRIVTHREGEVRQDSPDQWLRWTILATFGEYELRQAKVRAAGAKARRVERGDHIGRVGYGYKLERRDGAIIAVPDPSQPLEPIINAVREAGSILGGAKRLQKDGIPAPDGGPNWGSTTLRRIIERAAPELIPTAGPTGRRQPSRSSALAQLLVCHCRDEHDPNRRFILTPEPARIGYRCTRGNRIGRDVHGPVWVSEKSLLPWVKVQAARLDIPADGVALVGLDERRADLAAQLARAQDLYVAGEEGWTLERYEAVKARARREQDAIAGQTAFAIVAHAVDWANWPAARNSA